MYMSPYSMQQKHIQQYTISPDTSPLLGPKQTKYIQSVTSSLLYYGRALDHTILPVLNEAVSE